MKTYSKEQKGNTTQVIGAFLKGEEMESYGGNLKSLNIKDKTVLIGYGWAVYAERWHGQFYFFPEWHGYSRTTSKHYREAIEAAGTEATPQGVCIQTEGKPTLAQYAL